MYKPKAQIKNQTFEMNGKAKKGMYPKKRAHIILEINLSRRLLMAALQYIDKRETSGFNAIMRAI
jgi:hypothetical protein